MMQIYDFIPKRSKSIRIGYNQRCKTQKTWLKKHLPDQATATEMPLELQLKVVTERHQQIQPSPDTSA